MRRAYHTRRVWLAPLAVLAAAAAQQPSSPDQTPAWVVVVSVLAIILAAISFPDPLAQCERSRMRADARVAHVWPALLVTAVVAIVVAFIWSQEPFRATHLFPDIASSWAALLWICAVAGLLIVVGSAALPPQSVLSNPGAFHHISTTRLASNWPATAALATVLAIAAMTRLWKLGSLPYGVWLDEVDSAASAQRLLHLPFQAFAPGNYGHNPSLYYYVMAALLHTFGSDIAVIRLTSAFFGLLTVVAAYLLGKSCGGAALGIIAAFLTAVSSWAITFSHLGMQNISTAAMLGLGMWALFRAQTSPTTFWFLLSGVLFGLSWLTYAGAYLPTIAALVAVGARLRLDSEFRTRALAASPLLLIGLLFGALPFLVAAHLDAGYATARADSVAIYHQYGDWPHLAPAILRNVVRHALMFTVSGDRNGLQNLPGAPVFDRVGGACFLVGFGIALRRIRSWPYMFLLFWMLSGLVPSILSLDGQTPSNARSIGVVVPTMLFAALPLALLWRGRAEWQRPPDKNIEQARGGVHSWFALHSGQVFVVLVIGMVGYLNLDRYFHLQATNVSSWTAAQGAFKLAGQEIRRLEREGYVVRVDPTLANVPQLNYLVLRFDAGEDVLPFDPENPIPDATQRLRRALIVLPEHYSVVENLRRANRNASFLALSSETDPRTIQLWVVTLPAKR